MNPTSPTSTRMKLLKTPAMKLLPINRLKSQIDMLHSSEGPLTFLEQRFIANEPHLHTYAPFTSPSHRLPRTPHSLRIPSRQSRHAPAPRTASTPPQTRLSARHAPLPHPCGNRLAITTTNHGTPPRTPRASRTTPRRCRTTQVPQFNPQHGKCNFCCAIASFFFT